MATAGYNWTGAYVGAQGGYGFGRETWPDFIDPTLPGFGTYDVSGGLAGVNGGVNVQSGSFVFGVEGEWMWTGIKGGQTVVQTAPGTTQTTTLGTAIDWLAIASARAGFVVRDRWLVYGKAGVAIADEKHSVTNLLDISGLGSSAIDVTAKAVHTGIAVGLGTEYALAGNWSVKLEYDYIKMLAQPFTANGTETFNIPQLLQGQISYATGFSRMPQDLQLLKFGVNYHFSAMPGATAVLQ
jgi:opacity protein-like surface antigen